MVPARIGKFLTIGTMDSGTPKDIESSCHSCFLFLSLPLLHVSPHRSVSLCLASCSSFLIRLSTRHVNPSNLTSLILDSSLILESNGERLDYLSLYHVLLKNNLWIIPLVRGWHTLSKSGSLSLFFVLGEEDCYQKKKWTPTTPKL